MLIPENSSPRSHDWEMYILAIILPMLLAVGLGLMIAMSITEQIVLVGIILVLLPPGILLFNRYPLMALIFWLLLMPFLQPGVIYPQVLWIVHRALIPLTLGLNILSRLLKLKKHPSLSLGWPEVAMLIFLTIAIVSILFTQSSPLKYIYELYDRNFIGFAAYWLIRFLQPQSSDLKKLFPVVLFIAVAEIIVGFWAWLAPHTLPWLLNPPDRMTARMSGSFNNPLIYAHLMMFCVSFLFYYAMHQQSRNLRFIVMLIFGIGLVCNFLTFTRSCWLATLLTLLGLIYLYPKPVLIMVGLALPLVLIFGGDAVAEQLTFAEERLQTDETVNGRLVLGYAGEQMFYAKPIFGWGFASYDQHDWKFMERVGDASPSSWDIKKGTSHNTYITILAEMGLVGFFFQFFPVAWWLAITVKRWSHLPRQGFWSRQLLLVLWLSVGFYMIIAQAADMRFFWFSAAVLWLTLGFISHILQTASNNYPHQELILPG